MILRQTKNDKMTPTEYAANYKILTAKYQVIRPQVVKWANSLTIEELTRELADNGARRITDLVDIVTRRKTLA
jgi:hypothetical protein